jgi:hypothetical protein
VLQGQWSGRLQWDKPSEPDTPDGGVAGGLGNVGAAPHTLAVQEVAMQEVANLSYEMEAKVHGRCSHILLSHVSYVCVMSLMYESCPHEKVHEDVPTHTFFFLCFLTEGKKDDEVFFASFCSIHVGDMTHHTCHHTYRRHDSSYHTCHHTYSLRHVCEQLRFFYAVWGVTNKNEDVPRIVASYVNHPASLDDVLRQRFFGTDLTWSSSALKEHVDATRIKLARNADDAPLVSVHTENARSLIIIHIGVMTHQTYRRHDSSNI